MSIFVSKRKKNKKSNLKSREELIAERRLKEEKENEIEKNRHSVRKSNISEIEQEKNKNFFSQTFLQIKNLEYGVIQTEDDKFIKIIEVLPINFDNKSNFEKNFIVNEFAKFLKIAKSVIQVKTISTGVDSEFYINKLNQNLANETDERVLRRGQDYANLLRTIGDTNAIKRRYFFIFKYEPSADSEGIETIPEICQDLQSDVEMFKAHLGSCGNRVIEYDDFSKENNAVMEILYTILNRRSSLKETLKERAERVVRDTMKELNRIPGKDDIPDIPISDLVSPRGIDLRHKDYLIMDGLYYSFLLVSAEGYPEKVSPGWATVMTEMGDGIDTDIFLRKMDKDKINKDLTSKKRNISAKLRFSNETDANIEDTKDAEGAIDYFRYNLSSKSNSEFIYMSTIVTVTAYTLKDLYSRLKQVKKALNGAGIRVINSLFLQEQCLASYLPFADLDPFLFKKIRRNTLLDGASTTYVLSSFELCDENGVLLGLNTNSSLCMLDVFDGNKYSNANMAIIGMSGRGKTFLEQLLALRMRLMGVQTFLIAPIKGFEYARACENIGGEFIKISPSTKTCINIMEIRIPDNTANEMIDGKLFIEDSLLIKKIQQLNIFFSLIFPNMTDEEDKVLQDAIIKTYYMKNITNDNESLYDQNGVLRTMPVLGDLKHVLSNIPQAKRLNDLLSRYVTGPSKIFNNQTNVNLDNKYVVIDVSDLTEKELPIGMFIAMDYLWDKIKQDRTQKKAIIIGEIWSLISREETSKAGDFVLELFKIIRGMGGSAIASTQELSDFFSIKDGKYGKGIIGNAYTKIVLGLGEKELDYVGDLLDLSDLERQDIMGFKRGEGMIVFDSNRIPIKIIPSQQEKELITTDPNDLKKLKHKALNEKELQAKRELYEKQMKEIERIENY